MIDKELVLKAAELFYVTEGMDNMEPHDERFITLLDFECELFDLVAKMSSEEIEVYQELITHDLK